MDMDSGRPEEVDKEVKCQGWVEGYHVEQFYASHNEVLEKGLVVHERKAGLDSNSSPYKSLSFGVKCLNIKQTVHE